MLMVGGILLVLGVAAERSGQPAFEYLLIGILVSFAGFLLWGKLRRKPRKSTRFSLFRRHEKNNREDGRSDDQAWDDGYDD